MKLRLIIMRHGEAEPARLQIPEADHSRRLTPRGERQAKAMGARLAERGWMPTLGFASDSRRTRETVSGVVNGLGALMREASWRYAAKLYLTGLEAITEELRALDGASHETVVLVGHNPGFSEATTILTGEAVSLGTADAALMSIDADSWQEALAMTGAWSLEDVVSPL